MSDHPILIIGATGKTGSRIRARLIAQGHAVRDGSRRAPIPFDWEEEATWAPALDGVGAAYISYFPDLAIPGAVGRVARLSEAARVAGVGRLVLLSGRGEHHARLGEEAVRASGVPATLVRAAWFAQNFSEGYLRDPILAGVLPMPGDGVREPIIDADDIADVAVAALTGAGHAGKLYEVTGPRLLSFEEMAAILSEATGRTVRYQPISLEMFHDSVARSAGPAIADILTAIARETLDGRNAHLEDGVEAALGRAPRDFADFARRAAEAGAWARAA
ncbi:NmrA family NAD(P)-binding protein [Ovoidimarina sediminis]|uniref:NmrA family NAD(P)-binding protein n=1 Tax=Ovoidimarina sediminis TaxID=3079856 RepID=UPI002909EC78|nr:NmrA family NAD(P)-binding protein [Rhodophyticola sp. MJ-SS7]MDU8946213.1 NmrA family NAD(P)-binding protein [Rhodophyticola sp. MJ-SS7]